MQRRNLTLISLPFVWWLALLIYHAFSIKIGRVPDEMGHLGYIFHMFENWPSVLAQFQDVHLLLPEFLFDESIRLTALQELLPYGWRGPERGWQGPESYLIHPPLYYWLCATFAQLWALVSGEVSPIEVAYLSRGVSVSMAALGGLSLVACLNFLVSRQVVKPGLSVFLLSSLCFFVPSSYFVFAGVSCDSLAFLMICQLLLWVSKVLVDCGGGGLSVRQSCRAVALMFLGVLSKATAWPAVLIAGVIFILKLRKHSAWRAWSRPPVGILLIAIISGLWAGAYLVDNYSKYEKIQPKYTQVFSIPLEESSFYKKKHIPASSWASFAKMVEMGSQRFYKTGMGLRGHGIKNIPSNAEFKTTAVLRVYFLIFALGMFLIWSGQLPVSARRVIYICYGVFIFYLAVLLRKNWNDYVLQGYYGAQGHYLMGYYQWRLMGAWTVVDQSWRRWPSWWWRVLCGLLCLGLLLLLAHPFRLA